jgi:DinB superfamily
MTRLDLAVAQIVFARNYVERQLATIPTTDWFRMPAGEVTHIAWQVGHLAMAQYRLALERLRPRTADDESLISDAFLALFGRQSAPNADASVYPAADEILAVFRRVHDRAIAEAKSYSDADLDLPPLRPHPLAATRLWCLLWTAQHEMSHAGQIGLLRRRMGFAPLW